MERESEHTRWRLACRFDHGRRVGRCRCRWNRRLSTGHRLHMDWKHMGWRVGTFYLGKQKQREWLIIMVWGELREKGGYISNFICIPDHPGGQRQRKAARVMRSHVPPLRQGELMQAWLVGVRHSWSVKPRRHTQRKSNVLSWETAWHSPPLRQGEGLQGLGYWHRLPT